MSAMRPGVLFCLLLAVVLCGADCVSLTSFQSPAVLKPGLSSTGGGLAASVWEGVPWPEVDFFYRYGLFSRVDVGTKIVLPSACIAADMKLQLLSGPFLAALDVGGSYGRSPYIDGLTQNGDVIGAWPELIVGTARVYASARALMVHRVDHYLDGPSAKKTTWIPQVFVGGSFGDQLRVKPALSLTLTPEYRSRLSVVPGIGVAIESWPGELEEGEPAEW
jgi:hypothetical protein